MTSSSQNESPGVFLPFAGMVNSIPASRSEAYRLAVGGFQPVSCLIAPYLSGCQLLQAGEGFPGKGFIMAGEYGIVGKQGIGFQIVAGR